MSGGNIVGVELLPRSENTQVTIMHVLIHQVNKSKEAYRQGRREGERQGVNIKGQNCGNTVT